MAGQDASRIRFTINASGMDAVAVLRRLDEKARARRRLERIRRNIALMQS